MVYQPGLGVEAAQRSRGGDRKQTLAKDGAAGAMDATFGGLSFEVNLCFNTVRYVTATETHFMKCARAAARG